MNFNSLVWYSSLAIGDVDQSERFMDKDWETETLIPTLKLIDKSKKEEYVTYDGGHLFTLEMIY